MKTFKVGDRVRVRIGMNVLPEKGRILKIWHWDSPGEPRVSLATVILDGEPEHPRNISYLDMELVSIVEQVGEIQT